MNTTPTTPEQAMSLEQVTQYVMARLSQTKRVCIKKDAIKDLTTGREDEVDKEAALLLKKHFNPNPTAAAVRSMQLPAKLEVITRMMDGLGFDVIPGHYLAAWPAVYYQQRMPHAD